jgi:hypothetical protein
MKVNLLIFNRDIIRTVYNELAPDSVLARHFQQRRQKGEFILYGPNQLCSIDGHEKIARWGFMLYGGIDGYSRYLMWWHLGFYKSRAITTLIQYLRVVRRLGWVPRTIRADLGKEVPLLSSAHWTLVRSGYTNNDNTPIAFSDCFYYGRSMDNIRIESWWGQLLKSCLSRWRVSFFL